MSYEFGEFPQSYTIFPSDYYLLKRVDLYDNNMLEVSLTEVFYNDQNLRRDPVFFHVNSIQLKANHMRLISNLVKELSVAPLKVTKRKRICEIVVDEHKMKDHLMIRRGWDDEKQKFLNGFELISTPTGCWMPQEVNPRFSKDAAKARLIKLILKIVMN